MADKTYLRPNIKVNCEGGFVNVSTNYTNIPGIVTHQGQESTPIYDNGSVDLNSENQILTYNVNEFDGDFSLRLKGKNFQEGKIISLQGENENIDIYYDNTRVYMVIAPGYYIYSNILSSIPQNTFIYIWIKRVNNLYDIHIELEE